MSLIAFVWLRSAFRRWHRRYSPAFSNASAVITDLIRHVPCAPHYAKEIEKLFSFIDGS
jgi:hypothetical protein